MIFFLQEMLILSQLKLIFFHSGTKTKEMPVKCNKIWGWGARKFKYSKMSYQLILKGEINRKIRLENFLILKVKKKN